MAYCRQVPFLDPSASLRDDRGAVQARGNSSLANVLFFLTGPFQVGKQYDIIRLHHNQILTSLIVSYIHNSTFYDGDLSY